jgi:exopolysaccharide production protein ExoZ
MIKRIDSIQLIRGLAALMICLFHLKGLLNSSTSHFGTTYFGGGAIGVSLFFLISGFIIVYSTQKSDGSLHYVKNFIVKRLIRIVPLYYIMVLFWVFAYDRNLDYFSKDITTLINTLCFVPIFDSPVGPSYGMPPLKVGWALNYEIFFYFIFGISLFMKRFRWVTLFTVFFSLMISVPLILKGFVSFDPAFNYQYDLLYLSLMTNPMMIYFAIGVAFGLLYNSTFLIKPKWIQISLLILSIGLFLMIYFRDSPFIDNFFITLAICSFLVFGLLFFNKDKGMQVPAIFVYLGDMSYSLFLIHPIVVIVLPRVIRFIGYSGKLGGLSYFFVLLICIFGLSILSYELFEKRVLKKLASVLTTPRIKKDIENLQPGI